MMKAFSFLTILESLSKKLSILRTKMHSDDLRVNHGTITSQLRVSRPFSHCASSGASFALSRRASHFAAILTILFTVGVGSVWGASPYNLDITSYAWGGTGNKSANDGTVTISGYIQSKTYNNTGSTIVAYLDGSNYLTVSATSACITSITVTANTDNNKNKHEIAYQTSTDGSSWSASTNIGTCANRTSAPTSQTANFSPAVQYVRFTKGGSNGISVGAISITYTDGGGETPNPDPDQPGTGGGDDESCETHVWYNNGAPEGATQATCFTFTKTPSGTNNQSASMTIDGKTYTNTKRSGDWNSTIKFNIPEGKQGDFYIYAKGTGSRTVNLTNGSDTKTFNMGTSFNTFSSEGLTKGDWTMSVNGNIHISMVALHVCPTSSTPEPTTYTVTFNANGHGTAPAQQTITSGGKATTPAAPTATGYTFGGWYTNQTCTNAYDFNTEVTSDITLYAKWTANSYTVTWNPAGGNWGGNTDNIVQTYEYGAKIIAPEKPSRTGYEFVEWAPTYVANETTMPAKNVTYTAQWTENAQTYTITYNVNRPKQYNDAEIETGFPAETTVTVNAGSTITLPNPSIKIERITVYTAKWKDASDNEYNGGTEITPTGDMTFTAQWTPQSWPIRYYESFDGTNLGTEITGLTPNQYTYGVATSFCAEAETIVQKANKTGYTWLGWWSKWNPDVQVTTAEVGYSGEFSLFAKWEEESVTPDPDPECETTTITYNLEIEGQNASQESTSDKITNLIGATPTGSTTTYSGFKAEGYSVRYGASATNDKVSDGVTFTFDVPSGYVFKPSAITSELMCYGVGGNGDNHYYQFVGELSSENGQIISGNVYPSNSDGASAAIVYTINNVQMTGTVTLRLNAVKLGGENQSFRIKSPITIEGQLCVRDCTAPVLSYSTPSINKTVGDEAFTNPLTNTNSVAVTYSSTNQEVATVDANGQVTIVGAGTTTITATAAEQTIGGVTYCSATASYTLGVNPAPTPDPEPGEGDCWNISDDAFKILGTITENKTVNGLNIVATSDKNVQVEENEQVFDGYTFTHRLKLNGTGDEEYRHLKFAVTGTCTIDVYLMSGSSDKQRTLKVAIGSFGSKEGTELVAGTTIAKQTYEYTGGATDIYMYSAGSGINIYQICVTYPATPTPGTGTETCITLGSDNSKDIKSNETATVGNYTITASGINWQSTSAKIDNDNDYIIITNSTGITAANVTAKSNILYVTYSSSIDGTESKTTEEVTATNDFTELTLDVPNGTKYIKLQRKNGGSSIYVSEICLTEGSPLPSCTTPILPDLENKKVCPGSNVEWECTASNTATLQENGETIAYQWTKKGNNTVLSSNTTLTLNGITEAAGGTYVVTAIVSAEGKASATATKEVTLTVTPATATPTITASASTIFAGNPVTLKATCASSGVTYQWYTCNDAEGNGESAIGNAKNAEYTPSTATAGTYYYKVRVTGNDTNSCGTAEKVYTLVVSNSGETTCGEIKGQFTTGAYTFDTDFIIYGINSGGNLDEGASSSQGTRCGGSGNYFDKQRFVVTFPVDVLSFSFIGYQSNLRTVKAVKTTTDLKTADTEYTTITHTAEVSQEGNCQTHVITPETAIPANTFVWVELSNGLNISEICYVPVSTADCTDPQVTATVDNATICAGTKSTVTFTATNYADGATLQWQKKNGNNWEKVIETTSATYTISSVTTAHAGQYRVIAEKNCKRISEEVTLTVLTAPTFNDFAKTASVMKGNALAISDVQATGATGYAWYKSADNSLEAKEDTKVGTSKDLLLAAASIPEAADQTFYLFCVASNSCGTTESQAITVTVTPFVEEECATAGNETNDHEFSFTNTGCSEATLDAKKVWSANSNSKYLTYTAANGRYFKTAKVQVAHKSETIAAYAYTTNGTNWTAVELTGLTTSLTTKEITFPENENVTGFRIGRKFDDKGEGSGNFYLYEACFTYENACTETTLTPDPATQTYNITAGGDFTEPTFTLKAGETTLEGQTLTYTSSNTAIATVDEEGNVEFEGMTGTVIITATFAGGEINETEYCACQGSYTITVDCNDEAPEIVAADEKNLDGCNNSITLEAKMQNGTDFADGTFQWYRDGEAIEGATSASYIVVRAGTYTVSRTHTCTTMSSNSAVVTNEKVEPEVERLTPFQYYHVDKTYSNQMKNRHLFAVTSYGILNGKRYHLTATRNGETLDLSSSTAFFTIPSSDNAVDTVMIDLNELTNKYAEGDEIVITCAPINSCDLASAITASITIHVIDQTPTLALICSGADGEGTRATKELVVGGDFLTGYNKADLCQQTGNKTFDPNTEWGFYTELKKKYIVTPVNGYAEFNKLNYEPFDILLLTDYPKASKSEAAATILDDMAALCDYRPLLSLKAHMVAKSPSKWAAKGFTTSPVVPDTTSQYANIVCYAHPMFAELNDAHVEGIYHDHDDYNQLVYKILTGPGHESNKGLQGFELADADNFVTIGLIHYNATAEVVTHTEGEDTHTHLEWTPAADDRQLVAIAERQANIEARMILFAINCGAQSMQTPMGRQVLLTCLDYLLQTDPLKVADCRLTFDNGEGNTNWGTSHYGGTGTKGDGKWSTAANWGPEYKVVPGSNNDVRIAAPCTVDADKVEVLSVHITEDGSLTIPADKSFTARSTILRADEHGNVYPTNVEDISLGSNADGNASLILNNERGDTKAGVAMYSKAKADTDTYSEAKSTWQYIGTPHSDVQNAVTNYYNSWLYQYGTESQSWEVIPNGGPLDPFRGYCITHPEQGHTYWMEGTLAATTNQDITIPAGKFVVVANSWTAPIQIHELTDDDMEGLTEKTIYFFNTGSDPEGDGELNKENGRYAAGTYVSVPIHSAPYTGDSYIPSMQGFYVVGGNADGTLHLDYERHVRAPRTNTPSGPMHAPARRVAADNEPQVAKFLFRGKRYDDRLIILERPDFTRGYDSGWDGEQWGGNAAAPMSYVVTETRWDAVSAIPEYEGTVIAFRAGEDSEYTIHFDYDGMEDALYLLDTDTQIYTRVLKGNSYTFTCTDKAEHNRFILTRKAPQIATGTDHINTGENAKAVKFIKDDKIFIFVNGMLYDATGKMVIR